MNSYCEGYGVVIKKYCITHPNEPLMTFWTFRGAVTELDKRTSGYLYRWREGSWRSLMTKQNGKVIFQTEYHVYFDTGMID